MYPKWGRQLYILEMISTQIFIRMGLLYVQTFCDGTARSKFIFRQEAFRFGILAHGCASVRKCCRLIDEKRSERRMAASTFAAEEGYECGR